MKTKRDGFEGYPKSIKCFWCNKSFKSQAPWQFFCSDDCYEAHKYTGMELAVSEVRKMGEGE